MRFTVAIDGPAAAGKGTISKAVAAHFGLAHLDTGLLYRAVGRKMLVDGVDPVSAARALVAEDLAVPGLRTSEVAQAASKVAVISGVRAALVDFQRAFATRSGGAVLDGRDIGTVICPRAEAKLFVTASAQVRAHRRWLELTQSGAEISEAQVLADVETRDARDRDRMEAPLVAAPDALTLDTSQMDIAAAVSAAIAYVEDCRHGTDSHENSQSHL
jgi:cytidylate kinase